MTKDDGAERHMTAKRRLLRFVAHDFTENTCADAVSGLLPDEPEDMAEDLLRPIFELSDIWPEFMAKEIFGLNEDDETNFFEKREARKR